MSTESNKDLVRAYFVAFRDRDEAWWDRFIVDGRLVEHWALMDNLTMLKQIGAVDV